MGSAEIPGSGSSNPSEPIGPKQDDPVVAGGADDAPNSDTGSQPPVLGSRVAADHEVRRGLIGRRRSDSDGLRAAAGLDDSFSLPYFPSLRRAEEFVSRFRARVERRRVVDPGPPGAPFSADVRLDIPGGRSSDDPIPNSSFPGGRVGLGIGVTILVIVAVVIGIAFVGDSSESAPDSSVALTTTVAAQSAPTSPPQSMPPVTQTSPTPTSAQQSSNGTPTFTTLQVVQPTAPPVKTQPPTTLDMNADADQDGVPSGIEIQAGSDPKDPLSTPEGPNFVDQYGTNSCQDQADNDLDGKIDAADPSCA